jgi:hypothetical protein
VQAREEWNHELSSNLQRVLLGGTPCSSDASNGENLVTAPIRLGREHAIGVTQHLNLTGGQVVVPATVDFEVSPTEMPIPAIGLNHQGTIRDVDVNTRWLAPERERMLASPSRKIERSEQAFEKRLEIGGMLGRSGREPESSHLPKAFDASGSTASFAIQNVLHSIEIETTSQQSIVEGCFESESVKLGGQ